MNAKLTSIAGALLVLQLCLAAVVSFVALRTGNPSKRGI
jgi:hypothetical protein